MTAVQTITTFRLLDGQPGLWCRNDVGIDVVTIDARPDVLARVMRRDLCAWADPAADRAVFIFEVAQNGDQELVDGYRLSYQGGVAIEPAAWWLDDVDGDPLDGPGTLPQMAAVALLRWS